MDERGKEDLILEAICDKGCWTIQAITDTIKPKLRYSVVWRIINSAGLLSDLKEMRVNEESQLIREYYTYGMTQAELSERTGIPKYRLMGVLRGLAKELRYAKEEIAALVDLIVTEKADGDTLVLHALRIVRKPYTKLPFTTVCQRVVDVHTLPRKEYYKKWELTTLQGVSYFITIHDLQGIVRKRTYKKPDSNA